MTKVLEHKHIIIRAEVSEPITKRNKAIKFLNRIIKAIGMKSMYGPTASYCKMAGNRGITAFAIIETTKTYTKNIPYLLIYVGFSIEIQEFSTALLLG